MSPEEEKKYRKKRKREGKKTRHASEDTHESVQSALTPTLHKIIGEAIVAKVAVVPPQNKNKKAVVPPQNKNKKP